MGAARAEMTGAVAEPRCLPPASLGSTPGASVAWQTVDGDGHARAPSAKADVCGAPRPAGLLPARLATPRDGAGAPPPASGDTAHEPRARRTRPRRFVERRREDDAVAGPGPTGSPAITRDIADAHLRGGRRRRPFGADVRCAGSRSSATFLRSSSRSRWMGLLGRRRPGIGPSVGLDLDAPGRRGSAGPTRRPGRNHSMPSSSMWFDDQADLVDVAHRRRAGGARRRGPFATATARADDVAAHLALANGLSPPSRPRRAPRLPSAAGTCARGPVSRLRRDVPESAMGGQHTTVAPMGPRPPSPRGLARRRQAAARESRWGSCWCFGRGRGRGGPRGGLCGAARRRRATSSPTPARSGLSIVADRASPARPPGGVDDLRLQARGARRAR